MTLKILFPKKREKKIDISIIFYKIFKICWSIFRNWYLHYYLHRCLHIILYYIIFYLFSWYMTLAYQYYYKFEGYFIPLSVPVSLMCQKSQNWPLHYEQKARENQDNREKCKKSEERGGCHIKISASCSSFKYSLLYALKKQINKSIKPLNRIFMYCILKMMGNSQTPHKNAQCWNSNLLSEAKTKHLSYMNNKKFQNNRNTCAMCLAEMSSTITNEACHPCFRPKISRSPSSTWASTKPFWKVNNQNQGNQLQLGIQHSLSKVKD